MAALPAGCAQQGPAASDAGLLQAREFYRTGQYAKAEPILKDEVGRAERETGSDQLGLAQALRNLAVLYLSEGRYAEADPAFGRALAVKRAALPADDPMVAEGLDDLGVVRVAQARYDEVLPLYEEALAIQKQALKADDPRIAATLDNIGVLLDRKGRYAEAEPFYTDALAIQQKVLGPDSLDVAVTLNNLGVLTKRLNRDDEVEKYYKGALAIHEASLVPDHPKIVASLNNLAVFYDEQGRREEALGAIRRAVAIQETRIRRDAQLAAAGAPSERLSRLLVFPRFVTIAWRAYRDEPSMRDELFDETFQASQFVQASGVAATLGRVAARFATGDDELAGLIREQQDLGERARTLDQALLAALTRPLAERDRKAEAELREALTAADARLDALGKEVTARFPEYAELVNPEPVSVAQVQSLLAPDEALLAYLLFEGQPNGYLWVIRKDRTRMFRLEASGRLLAGQVKKLRAQLDPGQGGGRSFDLQLARTLHRELLPLDPSFLDGITQLLVVPHGPLESLPFALLPVADPPAGLTDLKRVDWLVRRQSTTVLPAATTLRALRKFAKPSRTRETFRGVGDPVLGTAAVRAEASRAISRPTASGDDAQAARGLPPPAVRGVEAGSLVGTRGLGDPQRLNALPPLPETAAELRELAKSLGADEKSLLLAGAATETAVKHAELGKARIVAFATHAGIAGEIEGVTEPALVLTPPAEATEEDDGLLTASEAAKLDLDADLVILSACNTAAPDGTPGAPGLSGLARAFTYAGSRALLVSHWQVYSDSAQRLTTGMIAELARNPGLTRAEALRRSMIAVLDGAKNRRLAHPTAWAPFALVGDGGPLAQHEGGASASISHR